MIEPHPPHSTPHTWKDFFLHIAVIVVGLLIAVGLEQSVEALHRHHERERLIRGLEAETRKTIRDCDREEAFLDKMIAWVRGRKQVLSDAARDHTLPGVVQPFPKGSLDLPDEPVYRLARSSGKLDLLRDEDALAYAEVDVAYQSLDKAAEQWDRATQQSMTIRAEVTYGALPGDAPFAHSTPEERLAIYKAYLAQERGMLELRLWCRQLRDAAAAVERGERDLSKIRVEEHRRQDKP